MALCCTVGREVQAFGTHLQYAHVTRTMKNRVYHCCLFVFLQLLLQLLVLFLTFERQLSGRLDTSTLLAFVFTYSSMHVRLPTCLHVVRCQQQKIEPNNNVRAISLYDRPLPLRRGGSGFSPLSMPSRCYNTTVLWPRCRVSSGTHL